MSGKRGVIMGVANKWSIAWGIAKALDEAGANIAFTCGNEMFKNKVSSLMQELSGEHAIYECDVRHDGSIAECFAAIREKFGTIDFLVHSIAFANKEYMKGDYYSVTREVFSEALDISCYSFVAAAREAYSFMNPHGSIVTLSYYGAEKWVPHYNIMGVAKAALEASVRYMAADLGNSEKEIRVNAISAGPIRTLSAAGIHKFEYIGEWYKNNSPLSRLVTIEEVGKTAVYLLSDLSSGVTGEVLHVDGGYHVVGMKNPNARDVIVE